MSEGNGQLAKAVNDSSNFSAFTASLGGSVTGASYTLGSATGSCTPSNSWTYYTYCPHSDSKTEKAYQVIRALMKAKLVKIHALSKFFELMDELVKVL